MTKIALLALVVLYSGIAIAGSDDDKALPGVLDDSPAPKTGHCSELKLEAAQKIRLKEIHLKFKEAKTDPVAQVEKARLKYDQLLADPKADLAAAKLASQEIVTAVAGIMQLEESYKTEVLFEILKPAQRIAANLCLKEQSWNAQGKFWQSMKPKSGVR